MALWDVSNADMCHKLPQVYCFGNHKTACSALKFCCRTFTWQVNGDGHISRITALVLSTYARGDRFDQHPQMSDLTLSCNLAFSVYSL